AAIAVGRAFSKDRMLRYAGIGNIAGILLSDKESRGLVSYNGTVGVQIRKAQALDYPWPERGLMVMHSDGLQTRWSFDPYPGLMARHPSVIAGVLWRDWGRGRDDTTVLV